MNAKPRSCAVRRVQPAPPHGSESLRIRKGDITHLCFRFAARPGFLRVNARPRRCAVRPTQAASPHGSESLWPSEACKPTRSWPPHRQSVTSPCYPPDRPRRIPHHRPDRPRRMIARQHLLQANRLHQDVPPIRPPQPRRRGRRPLRYPLAFVVHRDSRPWKQRCVLYVFLISGVSRDSFSGSQRTLRLMPARLLRAL